MAWPTLSSAAVSGDKLETTCLELFTEFLEGWFNGVTKALDGVQTAFPDVNLYTQGRALPQPLNGLAFQLILDKPGRKRRALVNGKRQETVKVVARLYVRAAGDNSGSGGPATVVRTTSDLLHRLLSSKAATIYLARKGIHHVVVQQPTVLLVEPYATRQVVIKFSLVY